MKKITVIYDKREKDFVVKYPNSRDGRMVLNHLVSDLLLYRLLSPNDSQVFNFVEELEKRGYDTKTLKFSVELKED